MQMSGEEWTRAFGWWLRTGRWPPVRTDDGTELKFNPYHDARNGRFTFAPGGSAPAPDDGAALAAGAGPEDARGSNSRAFEDPMTLEQAFPGLANGPPGMACQPARDLDP